MLYPAWSALRQATLIVLAVGLVGPTATGCATSKAKSDSGGVPPEDSASPCDGPECNGIDDDCDGLVDEPSEPTTPTWHPDVDGDGYGSAEEAVTACEPPSGHIADDTDCNDSDPHQHPGAWDTAADGQDSDCDGVDPECPADGVARQAWSGDQTVRTMADAEALCDGHDGVDGAVTVELTDWADLAPLSCLCVATGGLRITDNAALTSIDGLPSGRSLGRVVEVTDNPLLTSTIGLAGTSWTDVPTGDERLLLRENASLADISGFDGWRSLDLLQVRDLPSLTELTGLDDLAVATESVEVRDNLALERLSGLRALVSADELRIEDNPVLTELPGLVALRTPRYLTVGGNALTDLSDFAGVVAIDARLTVRNTTMMTSLSGLSGLQRLGGLEVSDNAGLQSLAGLADASAAGGISGSVVVVSNIELTDLVGLDWVTWIDGDLHLGTSSGPSRLGSLSGLDQLGWVTGDVSVARQREMTSMRGLGSLQEVGALRIDGTGTSSTVPFTLDGLDQLTRIHGTLLVRDHPSLLDLRGLDALTSTGDVLMLDNPALRALDGLEQLREAGQVMVLRNGRMEDVLALYGLLDFSDICVQVPGNEDEPDGLLEALGATEACP